ncbi:hypothetical protein ATC33_03180 [Staphylococcus epidermidis]|nr:hypothetical protein ATC33_03180 [Staphylococcus epidermidis]
MNQKVIELKQQYVNDTERIRHMISNKKKHIEEEKRKLVKHQNEFDKAQLDYSKNASLKLLDMVAEGSIDASELNAINEYLFGDSNDLDLTAEVTSNYENTSKEVSHTSSNHQAKTHHDNVTVDDEDDDDFPNPLTDY